MDEKNLDYDVPHNTKKTVVRLASLLKPGRVRLCIIGAFIILYTILTIYTPFKSAQVIDTIWQSIQAVNEQGIPFTITWDKKRKSIFSC